jgi:hypothetical protein
MKAIKVLAALVIISLAISSCATGYGCKGRSKTKTGFREEKFRGFN